MPKGFKNVQCTHCSAWNKVPASARDTTCTSCGKPFLAVVK